MSASCRRHAIATQPAIWRIVVIGRRLLRLAVLRLLISRVSLIEDVTAEIDAIYVRVVGPVVGMHRRMSNVRRRIVPHAVLGAFVAHSAVRIRSAVPVNFIE